MTNCINSRVSVFVLLLALLHQPLLAHPGAHASIAHYSQMIEQQPDNYGLYIQRGIAYSNDGQYPAALADLNLAAERGDPVLVSFDLGVLHYRMGEFEAARKYFDAYLRKFPDHAPCLEYRARLLRDQGAYEASVADFKRVFALLERPNPGHYVSVAEMISSPGETGIAPALDILDSGNAKLGLTPQLQQYAIQLELRRKRPDLAVERMHALEPMLGNSPEWKVEMAELYIQTGQTEQASSLLNGAARQLESLRKTPARIELRERIAVLQ
jgi:tetratricopeptide (TPR) repeat protein